MLIEIRKKMRIFYDSFYCKKLEHKIKFGNESSWHTYTKSFTKDTIVYSGGVGRDISFEFELAKQFNCQIYLYDPSSTAEETIHQWKILPNNIRFFKTGLSKFDKKIKFAFPDKEIEGSFKKIVNDNSSSQYVEYQCNSISNLIKINGHHKIDLLKIDIEGFEYEVLEDIIENNIVVNQICVEFHHFLPEIPKASTTKILKALKNMGYEIIHKRMTDYTFLLCK